MKRPVTEYPHSINGVPGRMRPAHVWPDDARIPEQARGRISSQTWISEGRAFGGEGYGPKARIHAEIRFDDNCKNGAESFAVSASVSGAARFDDNGSIGYHHEAIAKAFPKLAHLIRWHLTDARGPMHYAGNAVYLAGDRDCWGLRAGEVRQIRNERTGLPSWRLVTVDADGREVPRHEIPSYADGESPPDSTFSLKWVPWNHIGEGKARELDAARNVAVWPDATDAELMAEPAELRAALEARLPALLEAFRADIDAAGLAWDASELESGQ